MITKFEQAIVLFDKANQQDPNKEIWQGKSYPKELLYGIRMSEMLQEFKPGASEAVRLAARSQHICRWEVPRDSYPMNRVGYLQWRRGLYVYHADKASEILEQVGYDQEIIDNVRFLLQKKQLKRNEETQLLEDVICLIFLKYYFETFSKKYSEQKLIEIIQKTWKKMSDNGRNAALQLSYSDNSLHLINKALN